jgi:hypothetical protein
MNNNVEILRSICFTKEDLKNVTNLADSFTEKEIEFMVEFKKIYELGLGQLKKFIDKLDEEGKDLDTYTIQYYVDVLRNGPLGSYVKDFSEFKKYFNNTPDTLGILGNKNYTPVNITVYSTDNYSLGCATDTFNKLPGFIQTSFANGIKQVEDVFRTSLKSCSEIDNTLPVVDKSNQTRQDEEPLGIWVLKSNGNFLVKDSYFYKVIDNVSQTIFDTVKLELGEEDFRIYKDKKQYTPFDSGKNESTASINKIKKNVTENDNTFEVTLDLMGDVFDSSEKRNSSIVIQSASKDKEYKLNTVEGQLGN